MVLPALSALFSEGLWVVSGDELAEWKRNCRQREIQSLINGESSWQDEAACVGDPRFTQKDAPIGLETVCDRCPVFRECSFWAVGKSGVFAAGKWREDG